MMRIAALVEVFPLSVLLIPDCNLNVGPSPSPPLGALQQASNVPFLQRMTKEHMRVLVSV